MTQNKLLVDFMSVDDLAAEMNRHPRTVRRWMNQPDGLPYTPVGNQNLIHVPTARDWLLRNMRNPAPRRQNVKAAG